MPIYSIVVPCYNVAPYLPAFLSNIPLDRNDFELIFVDDCSTDQTLRIIRNFAQKNKNFFVFCHQTNQGLAASLNTGISKLRTIWFARLDPDDIVYSSYFQTVPLFLKPTVHLVRYKYQHVKNNKTFCPWWLRFYFKSAYGWSCIINVKKFGYPNYTKHHLAEDLEMYARQYKRSRRKTEVFIDKFLVAYRCERLGSIVNTSSTKRILNLQSALKTYWQNKEIRLFTRCFQGFCVWVDLKKRKRVLLKNKRAHN